MVESLFTSSDFNPRAPCGARLTIARVTCSTSLSFQSTRPLRGATALNEANTETNKDFNPRAPCGARPQLTVSFCLRYLFQSTRPLRGATGAADARALAAGFQSTRPLRGATPRARRGGGGRGISIHAPLAGRDPRAAVTVANALEISIHAPLAGRDVSSRPSRTLRRRFQSTRPLRGATSRMQSRALSSPISIHAPLAGRDSKRAQKICTCL